MIKWLDGVQPTLFYVVYMYFMGQIKLELHPDLSPLEDKFKYSDEQVQPFHIGVPTPFPPRAPPPPPQS